MPTGDLRGALRAHGHSLRPLVHVGKGGVTRGVLAQVAQTLFDHELVKVRIAAECPVDRFAVAEAFGVRRAAVSIVRGEAGRRKTVRIAGVGRTALVKLGI